VQEQAEQEMQNLENEDEKVGAGRFLYRVLGGFLIGVSVLAPGISGSIIAIMLGIYKDILDIFSAPTKNIKRNALYILPLAIGTVASMVSFILVFGWLFESFEKATYLFFVGLILGTIPIAYKELKKHGFSIVGALGIVISTAVTFFLSIAVGADVSTGAAAQANLDFINMVIGGLAMGSSLLIPGMSASVILMLLGLYTDLLFAAEAILRGELHLLIYIGVFAFCMFAAVILTSRFIRKAFEKAPKIAYAVVLGFIIGSFFGIGANSLQISEVGFNWFVGIAAFTAGTALSLFFAYVNFKKEQAKSDGQVQGA